MGDVDGEIRLKALWQRNLYFVFDFRCYLGKASIERLPPAALRLTDLLGHKPEYKILLSYGGSSTSTRALLPRGMCLPSSGGNKSRVKAASFFFNGSAGDASEDNGKIVNSADGKVARAAGTVVFGEIIEPAGFEEDVSSTTGKKDEAAPWAVIDCGCLLVSPRTSCCTQKDFVGLL